MSVEGNEPQSPQEIKDLINTVEHPEGVRPFSAELSDVAPHLEVPEHAGMIDPVTHNVDFDRITPDQIAPTPAPERRGLSRKGIAGIAAGAVGAALIGGLGAVKMFGGSNDNDVRPSGQETSAPAVPGTAESEAPSATETITGSAQNEGENQGLENQPTPEANEILEKYGLKVTDYPTFDDAVRGLFKEEMAYRSSGTVSGEPGNPDYLTALFGPNWQNTYMAPYVQSEVDDSVAVINRHIATGENGTVEYQEKVTITGTSDISVSPDNSEMTGTVDFRFQTNAGETVLPANDADDAGKFTYRFTNVDGYWQVTWAQNLLQ